MTVASPSAYWRGERPLWRAYWLVGVAGAAVFLALFLLLLRSSALGGAIFHGLLALFVLFNAWAIVATWRCAGNVRNPAWGDLARVLTVPWAINVILLALFLELDLGIGKALAGG